MTVMTVFCGRLTLCLLCSCQLPDKIRSRSETVVRSRRTAFYTVPADHAKISVESPYVVVGAARGAEPATALFCHRLRYYSHIPSVGKA